MTMYAWDFHYLLPPELIAQTPARPRDSSRLLVIDKQTGHLAHHIFSDLPDLLTPGDVLVFNQTKVIPARLFGTKPTGGKIEILLLKQLSSDTWEVISHPGIKPDQTINFNLNIQATALDSTHIKFSHAMNYKILTKIGHTPLPPYIHPTNSENILRRQYQTVYAKNSGSAAAPTAGLHFTTSLINDLRSKIYGLEYLTLHVGLGTFKTPTAEQILTGKLHSEWYSLDPATAQRLTSAKQTGKRIIAVGTTTCRVLESCSDSTGHLKAGSGETDIFIKPGYKFKFVDGLITNFHLPKTSLLMLISTLATPQIIKSAYETAVAQKYRFYSFGDACLII